MRKELKAQFARIEDKEEKTHQLIEHLADFLRFRSGEWCLYQALESEISLSSLLPKTPHILWVYPRVMDGKLRFFEPAKGFEKAYAGIMEPVLEGAREINVDQISGILVPGLGFDQTGGRIGKGKGYYDQALCDFQGETVGICFSSLVLNKLPSDPWDVKMNWLATEKGVKKVEASFEGTKEESIKKLHKEES